MDLDDTLLGGDLRISQGNKDALIKAMDKGVLVTIATGRMYRSAVSYAKELGIKTPIISYQGGYVKSISSKDALYSQTLSLDTAKQIIDLCKAKGLYLQVYIGDEYYIEDHNQYSEDYRLQVGVRGQRVGSLNKFLKEPPNKLLIIDEAGNIPTLREEFVKIFHREIEITTSKPSFLEFTHKNANKGKALEFLSGVYKIPREEIMAIGDGFNDISMIEYAGLGVAMDNAPAEVKEYADYVTSANNDDGVAQAIYKFVL